jgi:hypothetical protein
MHSAKSTIQRTLSSSTVVFGALACSQRFSIDHSDERADADSGVMRRFDGGHGDSQSASSSAGEQRTDDRTSALRADAGLGLSDAGGDGGRTVSGLVCGDGLRVETEACDPGEFDSLSVPCSSECSPMVVELDSTHDGETWGVHPMAAALWRLRAARMGCPRCRW